MVKVRKSNNTLKHLFNKRIENNLCSLGGKLIKTRKSKKLIKNSKNQNNQFLLIPTIPINELNYIECFSIY